MSRAEVRVRGEVTGRIGRGLVVLVGIGADDTDESGRSLAEKIAHLRIFDDAQGRMNLSLADLAAEAEQGGAGILCVSQFTLYGDCRKGRRPSYAGAAPPEVARRLYERFVEQLRAFGVPVATGVFQAMMDVELVNDGPVTLLLDSGKAF